MLGELNEIKYAEHLQRTHSINGKHTIVEAVKDFATSCASLLFLLFLFQLLLLFLLFFMPWKVCGHPGNSHCGIECI